jgi:O-methyltransferase involved in polyketide biosynthesis
MYLEEVVVRRHLEELSQSSAIGSRLALDFYPPRDSGTTRNRRQSRYQRMARMGSGEALELLVERPRAVELVGSAGWTVDEVTSMRDAAKALVPHDSGLPVDAINEHKTLIAAVARW